MSLSVVKCRFLSPDDIFCRIQQVFFKNYVLIRQYYQKSDIQIFRKLCVFLDKYTAGLDFIPHQK